MAAKASEGGTQNQSIGSLCDELGIKRGVVEDILHEREVATWTQLNSALLVNGIVVELHKWLKDQKYSITAIPKVLCVLFDVTIEDKYSERNVQRRVTSRVEHVKVLKKRRSKEELGRYMQALFPAEAGITEVREFEALTGKSLDCNEIGTPSNSVEEFETLPSEGDCIQDKLENVHKEKEKALEELEGSKKRLKAEVGRNKVLKRELQRAKLECEKVKKMNTMLIANLERLQKSERTQWTLQRKVNWYKQKLDEQSAEIKALKKEKMKRRNETLDANVNQLTQSMETNCK